MDFRDLVVDKIKSALPDAVEAVNDFRGERTLRVRPARIVGVCRLLRDDAELAFDYLSDLSATDYFPAEPRFCVNYHLLSMAHNVRIRLSCYLPGEDPSVPSVTHVWPAANWQEREVFDMFGVAFAGHPDLRRILMPEDWAGHPQRRDYPLGYEEIEFTHNVDAVQATKPRPKTIE